MRGRSVEPTHHFAVLLAAGCLLIVLSLIWRATDRGRSAWTDDRAAAYSQAATTYHALSMQRPSDGTRRRLLSARDDYRSLRTQLDWARQRGGRVSRWLGWAGSGLIAIGFVGHLVTRRT